MLEYDDWVKSKIRVESLDESLGEGCHGDDEDHPGLIYGGDGEPAHRGLCSGHDRSLLRDRRLRHPKVRSGRAEPS